MIILARTSILLLLWMKSKYKILITSIPFLRLLWTYFIRNETSKYMVFIICNGFYDY